MNTPSLPLEPIDTHRRTLLVATTVTGGIGCIATAIPFIESMSPPASALAAGAPVTGAAISIDGGMPQHGHGLPTKPQVTRELGSGDYLVEGMKFNMGGWWVVKFHVTAAAGRDSIAFNLKL